MIESWYYDKNKYHDSSGERWHFLGHDPESNEEYENRPMEIYFRNDSKTFFGFVRFEKRKDNPYRWEKFVEKVMKSMAFRESLSSPETENVWSKNWK